MRHRDVKTTWLVQVGVNAMQRKDSSLEVEFEMSSWTKEMRTGKSTINGGKRRMETSKAIVGRDKQLKGASGRCEEP
jgi:hypothetical protein